MSSWTQEDIDRLNAKRGAKLPAHLRPHPDVHRDKLAADVAAAVSPSKYRNLRTLCDGFVFDSKREANYWLLLKARVTSGEITHLQRQVRFPLYTPELHTGNAHQYTEDSAYIADYTFRDLSGALHVVDAKGKRTRDYALKAKRLLLQHGIIVEEV